MPFYLSLLADSTGACVVLGFDATIVYFCHFVSYAAGADYINDTMSYSWPASEAQQCYPFRPVNDAIVESTEQLRLILTSTSPRVMVAPAISTVMITDEDSEYAYTGTHTCMYALTHARTHAHAHK